MDMTPEFALGLRDSYCQQLEQEQKTFLNVVKAMPDDKLDFKPESRLMGFAELARHTAGTGAFFVNLIQEGETAMNDDPKAAPPPATSATALAAELEPLLKSTLGAFREATPEQLTRMSDFFGMGENAGVTYINWDLVHLIHHRAQMGLYVRIAGAKVPSIYGPTLDQTFDDMMAGS
ncbi:MAG: DinB family protein [Planctomycetes bacterium]|nr:DinB family protein [Planctomycetota bacterium]